jgi:hypothetical protein
MTVSEKVKPEEKLRKVKKLVKQMNSDLLNFYGESIISDTDAALTFQKIKESLEIS